MQYSTIPMILALLRTIRPKQWIKNTVVGVPLVFGHKLTDIASLQITLLAVALFCLISGCVYIINDIVDVERDRSHPKKRNRPVASGKLPINVARGFAVLAVPFALGVAYWLSPAYAAALSGYFVLNLAYCFKIKHIPYLDVLSLAAGFVLRVLAGAFVIEVPPSPWLMGCTALLALFLGFGKRAHELANSGDATSQRAVLAYYRSDILTWMLHILALITVVVYGLYTQSDHVRETFGDAPLIYTLPFPMIGIPRFIHLVTTRHDAESPTEEMLRDPIFMITFFSWLIVSTGVLYGWF